MKNNDDEVSITDLTETNTENKFDTNINTENSVTESTVMSGLEVHSTPVSYTHLDVYKRQVFERVINQSQDCCYYCNEPLRAYFPLENIMIIFYLFIYCFQILLDLFLQIFALLFQCLLTSLYPVSYTHLYLYTWLFLSLFIC